MSKREIPPTPDRAMLERAAAGREAVRSGAADPELVLSLVVWPTDNVSDAQSEDIRHESTD